MIRLKHAFALMLSIIATLAAPAAAATPVDPMLVRFWDEDARRIPDHVWRAIPRELLDMPVGRFAADIRAPVLILSAGADPLFSAEHHQSLVRAYPQAKAKVFAGLGHNFIVEHPHEVGPALAAFLAVGQR